MASDLILTPKDSRQTTLQTEGFIQPSTVYVDATKGLTNPIRQPSVSGPIFVDGSVQELQWTITGSTPGEEDYILIGCNQALLAAVMAELGTATPNKIYSIANDWSNLTQGFVPQAGQPYSGSALKLMNSPLAQLKELLVLNSLLPQYNYANGSIYARLQTDQSNFGNLSMKFWKFSGLTLKQTPLRYSSQISANDFKDYIINFAIPQDVASDVVISMPVRNGENHVGTFILALP